MSHCHSQTHCIYQWDKSRLYQTSWMKLWGHGINNRKRSAKTGLAWWYSSAHLSILALSNLHHGTVCGCEMDSFWIQYSQGLAPGVYLTCYNCCCVFIPCCWPVLVLGQGETRWNIYLEQQASPYKSASAVLNYLLRQVEPQGGKQHSSGVQRLNQSCAMSADGMICF